MAGITKITRVAGVPPDDLISIAEACEISGRSMSTVASSVRMGYIRSWPNPTATHPRQFQRLVSRADVLRRWPARGA